VTPTITEMQFYTISSATYSNLLKIAALAEKLEPKKFCRAPFQLPEQPSPCGICDGCHLHRALLEWREGQRGE